MNENRRIGFEFEQTAAEFAQRRSGRSTEAAAGSTALSTAQAQAQPQAAHAVHHATADGPREEVPRKAVPLHRRTGRIFSVPFPHRNSG